MTDYFLIFITTVLVNNFALVKFFGLYHFKRVSKKLEAAIGMGITIIFVITLVSICLWLMNTFILIPLNLLYLRTLSFILIIATVVQFTEIVVRKTSVIVHRLLGIFFPLIATNCMVLSVTLLNIDQSHSFLQSIIYDFIAIVGFSLVMILFSAIRERIAMVNIPALFRDSSIDIITACLMFLALMGFSGLVKF